MKIQSNHMYRRREALTQLEAWRICGDVTTDAAQCCVDGVTVYVNDISVGCGSLEIHLNGNIDSVGCNIVWKQKMCSTFGLRDVTNSVSSKVHTAESSCGSSSSRVCFRFVCDVDIGRVSINECTESTRTSSNTMQLHDVDNDCIIAQLKFPPGEHITCYEHIQHIQLQKPESDCVDTPLLCRDDDDDVVLLGDDNRTCVSGSKRKGRRQSLCTDMFDIQQQLQQHQQSESDQTDNNDDSGASADVNNNRGQQEHAESIPVVGENDLDTMVSELIREYCKQDRHDTKSYRIAAAVHAATGYTIGPTQQPQQPQQTLEQKRRVLMEAAPMIESLQQHKKQQQAMIQAATGIRYDASGGVTYTNTYTNMRTTPEEYERKYMQYIHMQYMRHPMFEYPTPGVVVDVHQYSDDHHNHYNDNSCTNGSNDSNSNSRAEGSCDDLDVDGTDEDYACTASDSDNTLEVQPAGQLPQQQPDIQQRRQGEERDQIPHAYNPFDSPSLLITDQRRTQLQQPLHASARNPFDSPLVAATGTSTSIPTDPLKLFDSRVHVCEMELWAKLDAAFDVYNQQLEQYRREYQQQQHQQQAQQKGAQQ